MSNKILKQESSWGVFKSKIGENKNLILQIAIYTNFAYLFYKLIPHLIKPGYPEFTEVADSDSLWVEVTLRILIDFRLLDILMFVNMVVLPLFVSLHPGTRKVALSLLAGLVLSIFISMPIASSYCSYSENPTECQEYISFGEIPYGLFIMAIVSVGGLIVRRFLDKRSMAKDQPEKTPSKGKAKARKPRVKRTTKKK